MKDQAIELLVEEIEWMRGGRLCGAAIGCYICGNLRSEGHKKDCKLAKILAILRRPACATTPSPTELAEELREWAAALKTTETSKVKEMTWGDLVIPLTQAAAQLDKQANVIAHLESELHQNFIEYSIQAQRIEGLKTALEGKQQRHSQEYYRLVGVEKQLTRDIAALQARLEEANKRTAKLEYEIKQKGSCPDESAG